MKGSPLARRTPLRRLRGLKTARRPGEPFARRTERQAWLVGMPRRCAVCPAEGGRCQGRVQGHHVIAKQALRRRGLLEHLWDRRNRMPVCERRHQQHETGHRRIPRHLVPQPAVEFANDLGLGWLLDRVYGGREERLDESAA